MGGEFDWQNVPCTKAGTIKPHRCELMCTAKIFAFHQYGLCLAKTCVEMDE